MVVFLSPARMEDRVLRDQHMSGRRRARMPEGNVTAPRRWNKNEDQVVRQDVFMHAHPGVKFAQDDMGSWKATYADDGNATQAVRALELGEVLDRLEEIFGSDPG